jgi:methyl-accepting chemotaxis protein
MIAKDVHATPVAPLPGRPWPPGAWWWVACSGCAALPLLAGVDLTALVGWLGVTLIAAYRLWAELHPGGSAVSGAAGQPDTHAAPALNTLLRGVLPVWRQHVGTVRQQTDDAVGTLVGSLGSITDQFEAAGFSAHAGSAQGNAAELLSQCEHKLQPVISTMNEIAVSKGSLGTRVKQLSATAGELQGMAEDVGRIAQQTNLLAINAAIEASRAGEAGRGFAVIAAEIRRLSADSADTARRITQRIAQINTVIADTSDAAIQSADHDSQAIAVSGGVITDVLAHVRELSQDSLQMLERGQVIRTNIESLIVGLQFQDRVSQVITTVDDDMGRLEQTLEMDESPPDLATWLAELQRHYTMRDQRHNHSASAGSPSGPAAPAVRKAVFF